MKFIPNNSPQEVLWSEVIALLSPTRNYWLNTINPDNSPHVSPVWGAVYSERLHFYTSRTTVKARNLTRDSRAVLHLESAEDVVIVHGFTEDLGEPSLSSAVMAALDTKYDEPGDVDYLPRGNQSFDVLYRFEPQTALLWRLADFETSQRRWAATKSP
ncbi:MAG TPA: pyridoxamine 5'-phosphate oxidase family protein [Acidimicrobiales bacterium]|nr:pyridoxamine 5'-phosphate oxidase family protein [Acidimicrobiales bacterium]